MKTIFRLLCLLGIAQLSAQEVSISNFKVIDQEINFDVFISQKHSDRERYTLLIYHSGNNFSLPIDYQLKDLVPNKSYKASFDGGNQIGAYEGELTFKMEIEASKYPIEVTDLSNSLKAGKNTSIEWFDYHGEGPYKVEIYQGQLLSATLAEGVSSSSFSGKVPKSLDPGNYTVLITPTKNSNLASERYPVVLKKALNPLIFVGAAVLAGGGAYIATSGGGGGEGGVESFEDPPGPPSGN